MDDHQTQTRPQQLTTTDPGTASGPAVGARAGVPYTIASFICAAIAVFLLPPVLGALGAGLGFVGWKKGHSLGKVAMILSIVAAVVGMVIGALVLTQAGGTGS